MRSQSRLVIVVWAFLTLIQPLSDAAQFNLKVDGRDVVGEHNTPSPSAKSKLVIAFHALASSAQHMLDDTGLRELSRDRKFILAAPQGRGELRGWAAGGCCVASSSDQTDVAFVNRLIGKLKEKYPEIDLQQIYLVGFSNGAILVHRLAYQLDRKVDVHGNWESIQIKGIATLAGTASISGVDLAPNDEAIPWIHFHGTDDEVINPKSQSVRGGFSVEKLDDSLEILRKRNNATVKQPLREIDDKNDSTKVIFHRWEPAAGTTGAPVVHVEIEGGGHTWPGHKPPEIFAALFGDRLGKYTQEIKAELEIQAFFDL